MDTLHDNERDDYERRAEEADRLEPFFSASVASVLGGSIRADALSERFYRSPYGEHMRTQPLRFAQHFGYERDQMMRDMGMDVDPVFHQLETGIFVARILEAELTAKGKLPCSDEEVGIVMLAAWVHDMGEVTHPTIHKEVGAVVGDIAFGEKTDENRAVEAAVRVALYRRVFPDVSIEVLERIEAIISHQDQTILHDIYEAAHSIQAYNTAAVAQRVYVEDIDKIYAAAQSGDHTTYADMDLERLKRLAKLGSKVQHNMGPHLLYWGQQFTYVEKFAASNGVVVPLNFSAQQQ